MILDLLSGFVGIFAKGCTNNMPKGADFLQDLWKALIQQDWITQAVKDIF
jgi:hypothetical protein